MPSGKPIRPQGHPLSGARLTIAFRSGGDRSRDRCHALLEGPRSRRFCYALPRLPKSLSWFADLVQVQRGPESAQDLRFHFVQADVVRLGPGCQRKPLSHPLAQPDLALRVETEVGTAIWLGRVARPAATRARLSTSKAARLRRTVDEPVHRTRTGRACSVRALWPHGVGFCGRPTIRALQRSRCHWS